MNEGLMIGNPLMNVRNESQLVWGETKRHWTSLGSMSWATWPLKKQETVIGEKVMKSR
jgi:hypothetical protein